MADMEPQHWLHIPDSVWNKLNDDLAREVALGNILRDAQGTLRQERDDLVAENRRLAALVDATTVACNVLRDQCDGSYQERDNLRDANAELRQQRNRARDLFLAERVRADELQKKLDARPSYVAQPSEDDCRALVKERDDLRAEDERDQQRVVNADLQDQIGNLERINDKYADKITAMQEQDQRMGVELEGYKKLEQGLRSINARLAKETEYLNRQMVRLDIQLQGCRELGQHKTKRIEALRAALQHIAQNVYADTSDENCSFALSALAADTSTPDAES